MTLEAATTMTWQKYVLVALYAISLLANIAAIGKPRPALTPRTVVVLAVAVAGMCALVVTA